MRVVVIKTLSKESRRWWDCGDKVYNEWTHEGLTEIVKKVGLPGTSPVIEEAYMIVYGTSGALRNLGGTAEIIGSLSYIGQRLFLFQ